MPPLLSAGETDWFIAIVDNSLNVANAYVNGTVFDVEVSFIGVVVDGVGAVQGGDDIVVVVDGGGRVGVVLSTLFRCWWSCCSVSSGIPGIASSLLHRSKYLSAFLEVAANLVLDPSTST